MMRLGAGRGRKPLRKRKLRRKKPKTSTMNIAVIASLMPSRATGKRKWSPRNTTSTQLMKKRYGAAVTADKRLSEKVA